MTLAEDMETFTVQPAPAWIKACESNACITVRASGENVLIRSDADSVTLIASRAEWNQHVADVKAGKLDHL